MSQGWEIAANGVNACSIVLAGRNSVHTWWSGIIGCLLFAWVFFAAQLYADMLLQGFFIATSVLGWMNWQRGAHEPKPQSTPTRVLGVMLFAGVVVAAGYGWLLHRFTDAYAPFIDSAVLAFSVLAQLLLMGRRVETWWFWLLVNSVATPLYYSRGLYLTAAFYALFWVNAVISLRRWRRWEEAP